MDDTSTIGLLYPGEMGAALARLLVSQGRRVVTTSRGRSERTARLGREAGVAILDSLADLVRQSAIVFSIVPPAAASEVADDYLKLARSAPPATIYVDVNSIGPESAQTMARAFAHEGVSFVDAAINGLARNIATGGTFFLSGPRAAEIASLTSGAMRTRVLGSDVGPSKTMKMLLGGLSKGLCALFMELACVAEHRQMLPQMFEACVTIYPGMTAVVERMLPTYAQHAGRRATEMKELERTAELSDIEPCLLRAVRQSHEQLADVPFEASAELSIAGLIQQAMANGFLEVDREEVVR